MSKSVFDPVLDRAAYSASRRVDDRMMTLIRNHISERIEMRLWDCAAEEVCQRVLDAIRIPNVIERAKESIAHSPEDRVWDRVDGLVTDRILLYAWDRTMIPGMDRIFNRVFNPVEEDAAPPRGRRRWR